MNILVTGASGFSGSHIIDYLESKGHYVLGHHGLKDGNLSNFATLDNFCANYPIDVIVHTAAKSPDKDTTNWLLINNILMTKSIISLAKNKGVKKIIYFSSDSLYGEVRHRPVLEEQNQITNPSIYGCSKIMSEALLQESGVPTISLRLPLIVGKGARRNWLARMMEAVKQYHMVTIYNPDAPFNNAIHIRFLSEFVEKLINMNWNFTYDMTLLGSCGHLSIREVANKLCKGRVPTVESKKKTHSHTISIVKMSRFMNPWLIEKTIDEYVKDESI